jgi:branched-chain amino acid transport system permease protein
MMSRPQKIGLVVVVVLLLLFPFVINDFMTQVAVTTITYAMLGLTFGLGMRVGLPRLDIIAWYGVGAYTTAILRINFGMPFLLAILIAGLLAAFLSTMVHLLTIPRGMLAFFVFNMVFSMAVYQMFGSVPIFGGWGGLTGVPSANIGSFVFNTQMRVYYLGLFFMALTCTVYYLLYQSRIGRAWNAIASSLALARSAGIDVVKYRLASVTIGTFFVAVTGGFFVSYYRAAIPAIFGFGTGVYILVYLIIGGYGHSLIGPILGAIIATFIPEYLRFAQSYQAIASSIIVILILMFLPMGILGWVDRHIMRRLNRRKWYARYIVGAKV